MCVAILCEGGARPTDSDLDDAARTNDDGAGLAWIEEVDGEPMVAWQKGLNVDDVKTLVPELPHPFVIHFRKQSAGTATDNLCHPFPIGPVASDELEGHAKRVLFHNGTVKDWKDHFRSFIASRDVPAVPDKGLKDMSDTRAMAYMIHHATELHEGEDQKLMAENLLQVFCETSRWAVLDADAWQDEDVPTFRLLGTWWYCKSADDEDEVEVPWYSNSGQLYEGGLRFSNRSWRTTSTTT